LTVFFISNFRRVLNVVRFLPGNSPASEFYMPTFRKLFPYKYSNILKPSHLHTSLPMKMEQSVPNRRHIKFRRRGITRKKAYNIYWLYCFTSILSADYVH